MQTGLLIPLTLACNVLRGFPLEIELLNRTNHPKRPTRIKDSFFKVHNPNRGNHRHGANYFQSQAVQSDIQVSFPVA
jgi:hypothetical protein